MERPDPAVPGRMMAGNAVLRVTAMFVVEPDGMVDHIRLTKFSGIPEFDALMAESIKDWVFSPAIKGGKKVRCLIEVPISVRQSSGSRFGV
jgi:TonB family protein